MAIKTYKPVTNGRRNMTSLTYEEITTNKPEKSLVAKKSKNGGRNNQGVITTRHHGGGHKQAAGVKLKTFDEAMDLMNDLDKFLLEYNSKEETLENGD